MNQEIEFDSQHNLSQKLPDLDLGYHNTNLIDTDVSEITEENDNFFDTNNPDKIHETMFIYHNLERDFLHNQILVVDAFEGRIK